MAPPSRAVDYLAAEPVRVAAILRLPMIALIAFIVAVCGVVSWLPRVYGSAIVIYFVAAVV